MTEPCMFPNLHEPFYCRIHADVRLRLTDERCRRGVTLTQPQPDAALREALRRLVESAVLVPMVAEDDDDVAECWVVHSEPLEEARAALRSTPAAPKEDTARLNKASGLLDAVDEAIGSEALPGSIHHRLTEAYNAVVKEANRA